jgi:adenylylsulfate kinase-like enzyme
MKKKEKKGYLIWITGLSGSGKTSLANLIKSRVKNKYGKTLVINGDDLREIFKFNKYDKNSRLEYGKQYCKLLKLITDQNINVIFTVVGLFSLLRKWNRKYIRNYIEVYLKADVSKIKKKKRKKIYLKNSKSIVGLQIKPEFPKTPDIIIENDFSNSLNKLSDILFKKLITKIK